jgi:hypothetical protein
LSAQPCTMPMSLVDGWALKRCGQGGYVETPKPPARRQPDEPSKFVVVYFPTAEIARDFAAAFEHIGAKLRA